MTTCGLAPVLLNNREPRGGMLKLKLLLSPEPRSMARGDPLLPITFMIHRCRGCTAWVHEHERCLPLLCSRSAVNDLGEVQVDLGAIRLCLSRSKPDRDHEECARIAKKLIRTWHMDGYYPWVAVSGDLSASFSYSNMRRNSVDCRCGSSTSRVV
jgi:hypothetical protein